MPDPGAQPLPLPEEPSYTSRPLDASSWNAFADVVERNNGIYGGCWCARITPSTAGG
jgi:hypothetical protein